MAVGAAKAPHPERQKKAFEVSLDIAVSPDAGRRADQASHWSGPRVLLAELH
jgi:hypothetical protein